MGLGWVFFTLFGVLELVFSGPQGRNIIKHHLSKYLETAVSAFSFFYLTMRILALKCEEKQMNSQIYLLISSQSNNGRLMLLLTQKSYRGC